MATINNEDGTVTVTLAYPITAADGSPLSQLTLKRPTAKLMRAMDKGAGEVSRSLYLLQAMTGVALPLLDALDGADYLELSEAVSGFLQKSPATGAA